MIRKSIIFVLSLLAMATGLAGVASFYWEINCYRRELGKRRLELNTPRYGPACWVYFVDGWFHVARRDNHLGLAPPAKGFKRKWETFRYPYSHGGAQPDSAWRHREFDGVVFRWLCSDIAHEIIDSPSPVPPGSWDWSHHREVRVGAWGLVAILGAYPAIAFFRGPFRRHRRRKHGLCVTCGYNLTGNVSGVCPECGERI